VGRWGGRGHGGCGGLAGAGGEPFGHLYSLTGCACWLVVVAC